MDPHLTHTNTHTHSHSFPRSLDRSFVRLVPPPPHPTYCDGNSLLPIPIEVAKVDRIAFQIGRRKKSLRMYVCAVRDAVREFVLCAHVEQAAYFHFVIKIQSKFRTLSM